MIKKFIIIFFVLLCLIFPLSLGENSPVTKQIFYGSILFVGGSGPGNYSSIRDAIDNAPDGDTVFVYSGTYQLSTELYFNKSINLIGEHRDTTTIIPGDAEENQLILIRAKYMSVSRFTFRNIIIKNYDDNVKFINNTFRIDAYNQAWGSGVINSQGSYNSYIENTIVLINQTKNFRPYSGLNLEDLHSVILNNTISGAKYGLDFGGENNTVSGNTFIDNKNV